MIDDIKKKKEEYKNKKVISKEEPVEWLGGIKELQR